MSPEFTSSYNNQELRKAISQITNRYGQLPEKKRLGKVHLQISEIERLLENYQHSISLVRQVMPENVETWKYCCFEHAFDLINPYREDIRNWNGKCISVDSAFTGYLIQNHLLKQDGPKSGCIVVYYSGTDKIKHAGKVIEEDFVESKWGWQGHLWKHRIYEIPESYGSKIRFFSNITAGESSGVFTTYVSLQQKRPGILVAQH